MNLIAKDAPYTNWEGARLMLSPGFSEDTGVLADGKASPVSPTSQGVSTSTHNASKGTTQGSASSSEVIDSQAKPEGEHGGQAT